MRIFPKLIRSLSLGFLLMLLFCADVSSAQAAVKYAVGTTWNSTGNWSTTSGGAGGAGVPGAADVATFDANSPNMSIDANANVLGVNILGTYANALTQSSTYTITVGTSNWTQAGGAFAGGSGAITFNGAFALSGGTFTSTSGILTTRNNWTYSSGTFGHNNGTVAFVALANTSVIYSGSLTLWNVTYAPGGISGSVDLSSGTVTVLGALTFAQSYEATLNNGTIEARGGYRLSNHDRKYHWYRCSPYRRNRRSGVHECDDDTESRFAGYYRQTLRNVDARGNDSFRGRLQLYCRHSGCWDEHSGISITGKYLSDVFRPSDTLERHLCS